MSTGGDGWVTRWIGDLKAGNNVAADRLWHRDFDGLVRLARKKLDAVRRVARVEDEEDAASSAFHSLCAASPSDASIASRTLTTSGGSWSSSPCARFLTRSSVSASRVVAEAELVGVDLGGPGGFAQCLSHEPTPEFVAMLSEEFQRRIDSLEDPTLRQVALWRMEGYSNNEIAERLAGVGRSVERKLELIRKAWLWEEA